MMHVQIQGGLCNLLGVLKWIHHPFEMCHKLCAVWTSRGCIAQSPHHWQSLLNISCSVFIAASLDAETRVSTIIDTDDIRATFPLFS